MPTLLLIGVIFLLFLSLIFSLKEKPVSVMSGNFVDVDSLRSTVDLILGIHAKCLPDREKVYPCLGLSF